MDTPNGQFLQQDCKLQFPSPLTLSKRRDFARGLRSPPLSAPPTVFKSFDDVRLQCNSALKCVAGGATYQHARKVFSQSNINSNHLSVSNTKERSKFWAAMRRAKSSSWSVTSQPRTRLTSVGGNVGVEKSASTVASTPSSSSPSAVREGKRLQDTPGKWCRICHDGSPPLVSPCLCSGTVALIHKRCLERWLTITSSNECELCRHRYTVQMRPPPCYRMLCASPRRAVLTDLLCFVGLTPLVLAAVCLCLLGAFKAYQDLDTINYNMMSKDELDVQKENRQWEGSWLVFLAILLLSVYVIWFSFTCVTNIRSWKSWREANQRVKLTSVERPVPRASVEMQSEPIEFRLNDSADRSDDVSLHLIEGDSLAESSENSFTAAGVDPEGIGSVSLGGFAEVLVPGPGRGELQGRTFSFS